MSGWLFERPDPEAVVRDHGDAVYRQLRRIFGPRTEVDDVFQNVFIEVLRSLPSWKGRASLRAWIRKITWNVAYQEMRQSYRRPDHALLDDDLGATQPLAEEAVRAAELYRALDQLDPKLRIVIVLYDLEGCTLKEVGKTLGRPLPTIQSQLKTGRERLVKVLRGEAPRLEGRRERGPR